MKCLEVSQAITQDGKKYRVSLNDHIDYFEIDSVVTFYKGDIRLMEQGFEITRLK